MTFRGPCAAVSPATGLATDSAAAEGDNNVREAQSGADAPGDEGVDREDRRAEDSLPPGPIPAGAAAPVDLRMKKSAPAPATARNAVAPTTDPTMTPTGAGAGAERGAGGPTDGETLTEGVTVRGVPVDVHDAEKPKEWEAVGVCEGVAVEDTTMVPVAVPEAEAPMDSVCVLLVVGVGVGVGAVSST